MFPMFQLAHKKRGYTEMELLLIEQISNGKESALSELYNMYSRLVFSIILRIVKCREEAEELMQSVFIKIWNKASDFDRNRGNVYSWLITLARNSAIDRLRSKQFKYNSTNHVEFNETEIYNYRAEFSELDSIIINERAELVNKAIKNIPAEQSVVIELAYFEGLTQSEMAEELKIPLGTVKTRMRKAHMRLEKSLNNLSIDN